LFLCTVKNNDRKFVEFALRKSIVFVHSDVYLETSELHSSKKFNVFSCKFLKIL
jgi:hypothetical protein